VLLTNALFTVDQLSDIPEHNRLFHERSESL